ncbi:putative bifunctional diguanylate cyclase/phosphodiesterase [Phyllobacterium meliloti]|uniref:putative bifunctional diguanylate cyclase/phosphodiesterase n=1 Tax=Phyllobacterium meliloti TaxID=555317 RepID=UPI001D159D49|nr:EAL domain-containing protein [Phyllobacterium sp. T1293]UGX87454.1 EAL domain-containing protein [Phyllobacterium sp. T1293]
MQGKRENESVGFYARFWSFVVRNRVSIQDLGILLAILLVLAYVAFQIDIFETEGSVSSGELLIELDETLLLGSFLALGLLGFAIRRYLEQKREIARRIEAEKQARILAYQDPLTGLANRRQFEEALRMAIASPPRTGAVHAVIILDLNGFKQINDAYGHGVGDDVLVVIGQRLQRTIRDGDLLARLGGDEFIILAQHLAGAESAANIALRIVDELREPIVVGSIHYDAGAGIGIALLPTDAHSGEDAVRKADVALYRAKAERRSTFRFFEQDMDRLVQEREQLERDLRAAVANDGINVRFRPSFDLRSGKVIGFEAVPSWIAADGKEVPPDRFLPIAEETGLIYALGQRIFEKAFMAARQWPANVTLSIDVLPGQLRDREFGKTILQLLQSTGFAAQQLDIEITESLVVHDLEAAKLALGPLRAAGVKLTLDNFGTGYSNLYHIQEFKLDKIKIDRRFIENMNEEETAKMVRALAGLGQGLGLVVSADGLEGRANNETLLRSGVDQWQSSGDLVTIEETERFFKP